MEYTRLLVWSLYMAVIVTPCCAMMSKGGLKRRASENTITISPLERRDENLCSDGYSLCPSLQSGGCCPSGYSCGVSSCYLATTPPPSACSKSGYIPCGLQQGGCPPDLYAEDVKADEILGGCCPAGYICTPNGCLPPVGSSYSQSCGATQYLCPESVGYGCCKIGLACGSGYCYQTSSTSISLTITVITTDSNSNLKTITETIQTMYIPTTMAMQNFATASSTLSKLIPMETALPKAAAMSAPTSSGGLTNAQVGGIIGAAVAIMISVSIATFLILRRLNAISKQSKKSSGSRTRSGSKPESSSFQLVGGRHPGGNSGGGGTGKRKSPSTPDIDWDSMSIDPLIMSNESAFGSPEISRPYPIHRNSSGLEARGVSPPIPSRYTNSRGYQQISNMDPVDLGTYSSWPGSIDASPSPPIGHSQGRGYFPSDPDFRDQNLRHGHQPPRPGIQYTHGRQWSDASEVSQISESSGGFAELDTARPEESHRSSVTQIMQAVGFGRPGTGRQRRSSEISMIMQGRKASGDTPHVTDISRRLSDLQEDPQTNDLATGILRVAPAGDEQIPPTPEVIPPTPVMPQSPQKRP